MGLKTDILKAFEKNLTHIEIIDGKSETVRPPTEQFSKLEILATDLMLAIRDFIQAQTFTVTVQSYYGANKYYIDGSRQATVTLSEGSTYRFDQSDSSNSGHPLRLSATSDGTHAGGSEYTTGVTTNGTPGSSGAYTQITVASGAPTLYYYCTNHSGMGGQADTP